MTKLMKRVGAVLLCICMLMPMCPEKAFADTMIREAEIIVELPKVQNNSQAVVISVPDGANYDVQLEPEYLYWLLGNDVFATSINAESLYGTRFNIIPESGYTIASDATVTVNGSSNGVRLLSDSDNPGVGLTSLPVEFKTLSHMDGTVENVELTGVSTGAVGSTAEPYNYDGTNYTATGTWMVYNFATQTYDPMQNTDMFQQGKTYALRLVAETKKGYIFGDEPQLIIDGENFEIDGKTEFSIHKVIYVSYTEEINTINFLSANNPKAEIGKTFTNTELDIPVPAGSHYTASGHWVYRDEDGNEFTEGTFESGKAYYLRISIVPEDGYVFGQDAELYVDNQLYGYYNNPALIEYEERVSFKSVIDKVTLLNLPTATVGGTAKVGEFDVEVPADANYTATAEWIEWDGNMSSAITESVFKANKIYELDVWIKPNEGYDFAETVYVNAYGVDHKESNVDPEIMWFNKEFSFLKEIEKVEIIGYTEPKIGDSAVDNLATLKVPADANYVIDYATWIDTQNYQEATIFEKGHDYFLDILVSSKEGYGFTDSTKAILNGKDMFIQWTDSTGMNINENISFKEIITEVQVTNIPTMEIGKTAVTDVKVPEGAKYTAEALWRVWDETKDAYVEFEGTFEKGKVYEFRLVVLSNEAYRFEEEVTKLKLDGKEVETFMIWSGIINYTQGYQTDHKVIERVELKIEEPVVGNHSSILPVITIVGDANFTVIDNEMVLQWIYETPDGVYPVSNKYFIEDKAYGVSFMIQANEGYVFADDLVIIINGKVIPEDAYTKALKIGDVAYIFGTGTKEKIITAPQTGDNSQIGLWIAFFLMGIFVCGNALMERKRK